MGWSKLEDVTEVPWLSDMAEILGTATATHHQLISRWAAAQPLH